MELRDIYLRALDVPAGEMRATFLNDACAGRDELRQEIEAMLANETLLDDFIETPASAALAGEVPFTTQSELQTQLGSRYELIRRLGEGGMGTVWLANQTAPIERTVAIKLLKPGLDSKSVLARFETERKVLAQLQHPNIATILDAGFTDDGRPFFVMEHCDGPNIVEHCRSVGLDLRGRLGLMISICRAISYVHRMGILHRDIKPSNVLVVEYDGIATPKVIDFGVAKAIGHDLPRGTWQSSPGGLIGTPEYMAPELLLKPSEPATALCDVYGLGGLLYELLVGEPPMGKVGAGQIGLLEYLRRVETEEALPPSRALRKSRQLLSAGSQNEADSSPAMNDLQRLDWVVLKALERDPALRYQDVAAFQGDLQAFLEGESVTAHPPSLRRRWTSWYKRHRALSIATIGTSVAASLLALALWQGTGWRNGDSKAGVVPVDVGAVPNIDGAESIDSIASMTLRAERLEKAFLADLRLAVRETTERLGRASRDRQEVERQSLRDLAQRWGSLAQSVGSDQRRRSVLAEAEFRLGQIDGTLGEIDSAIEKLRRAEGLFEGLGEELVTTPRLAIYRVENLTELGRREFEKGNATEALAVFDRAIEMADRISVQGAAKVELLHALADLHTDRGKVLLLGGGKPQDALTSMGAAMDRLGELERLAPDDPRTHEKILSALNGRAFVLRSLGRFEAAITDMRSAQDRIGIIANTLPDQEQVARLRGSQHLNLGLALQSLRNYPQATEELIKAKGIFEELVEAHPSAHEHRERLASTLNSLGSNAFLSGDLDGGAADCQRSAAVWEGLAEEFPSIPEYGKSGADVELNLGVMFSRAGRYDEAEKAVLQAMETSRRLTESYPDRVDFAHPFARAHALLAGIRQKRGDAKGAIAMQGEAISHFEKASVRFPDSVEVRDGLAMAFATRGDQFLALGDHRKALEDYRSAEGLVQRLPRQTAGLTQPRDLFSLQLACGQMHKELDEVDEAKLWIERAEKNLQQQLTLNPGDEAVKSKLERLAELRSQVSSDAP